MGVTTGGRDHSCLGVGDVLSCCRFEMRNANCVRGREPNAAHRRSLSCARLCLRCFDASAARSTHAPRARLPSQAVLLSRLLAPNPLSHRGEGEVSACSAGRTYVAGRAGGRLSIAARPAIAQPRTFRTSLPIRANPTPKSPVPPKTGGAAVGFGTPIASMPHALARSHALSLHDQLAAAIAALRDGRQPRRPASTPSARSREQPTSTR